MTYSHVEDLPNKPFPAPVILRNQLSPEHTARLAQHTRIAVVFPRGRGRFQSHRRSLRPRGPHTKLDRIGFIYVFVETAKEP